MRFHFLSVLVTLVLTSPAGGLSAAESAATESAATESSGGAAPGEVAAEVDRLIQQELENADVTPAGIASDEDFLRRITLDLAGTLPTARDVTFFGLDTDPAKRVAAIDRLLDSEEYAESWARYWRDVIFVRATTARARFASRSFVDWMTQNLQQNRGWDEIATDIVTATGDIREDGSTALIFAQEGKPEDIAGEVSRIFLGIQMQCANCHDHPWDRWKREQFHELAAFFPRIAVRPVRDGNRLRSYEIVSVNRDNNPRARLQALIDNSDRLYRFADTNRDGKLSGSEVDRLPERVRLKRVFDRLLQVADRNGDGGLTKSELKKIPLPPNRPGRGSTEHYMSNLNDPASRGRRIDPAFFVTDDQPESGLDDLERRKTLASCLTSPQNAWFSKAIVNRIWAELMGEGFYMPIDDIGPDRSASSPEVLEFLAVQFTRNGHDLRWLMKTITLTRAYQREIRSSRPDEADMPFASATPTKLRGDQLYSSIISVLGGEDAESRIRGRQMSGGAGMYRRPRNPRDQFNALFGFDPSTPREDVTGNIPQALFMMNSPQLAGQINARGPTRLAALLRRFSDNGDAVMELYLMVLSREPSEREMNIAREYIKEVGSREEAFEDLLWCLLNSSEFFSKR